MIEFKCTESGRVIHISAPTDSTIADMVDHFKSFLLAVGYHPDSVNAYLGEEND